jgi:hypothetical protein
MPPRKKPFNTSTRNLHRETQNGAHLNYSRAIQSSESAAGYNGPVTRSRVLRAHLPPTIHSLPLEILSEIFIFALPTDQELYRRSRSYEGRKLIIPTLVFCAVCSSWRFLAFSTPQLWNTVVIHLPHDINEAQAKRKAVDLVQWIERSRSLPLSLQISSDIIQPLGLEAPIISIINDHAARWESLYFQNFQPSSFLFHFDGWHSLQRLYYPVSCENETVPWAHLTHLQIRKYISCRDALLIFMKCPKLVYLSILVNSTTVGQSTVPIILEDLVTLYLKPHESVRLQTILHQLSLPSLRNIFINQILTINIEPFLNLFTRSSCTLDRLEICPLHIARDFNLLAHSSCDSLTSLTLCPLFPGECWPAFDEELLRRLTLHRNDTLCPHLTFLAIDCCLRPLHSALLDMVESRIGQEPEEPVLRYLRLHVGCGKTQMAVELDKVGRRSRMEYRRDGTGVKPGCFSVRFRRRGFREPPNFDEL